ncbi:zinc transporter ZIP10-like isoform X1 [Pomacea canaliculata]|uniref:zinc transporter ZIP10-like isoform X1 n=1 Tax=Pomacea canaliculata TaxID=400727 RepID=UPI000D738A81|nr:zinc transporter ZIP10-like isoform X1 [Pomacea canaliculata]
MMTTCDSLKSATRRKVGRTDIYTSLFVCLILTVLRTATSSGVQGADVEETAAGTNSIIAGSHLLPDGNISSTLDNNATSSQSIYFISVLFEKYSSSKLQLSLDGFTQLLCNLGLLHINDETGQADEISSAFKFVCKNITYSAFRAQNRVKHDSRQDQERTHAQADDDGDHDHNPNPFIMTTSSQEQPANDHTRGLHCFNHLHHNGDHFLGDHVSGALSDVTTHASRRKRTANIFKAVERRSLPSTTSKGQQLSSAAPWGYLNLAKCVDPQELFDIFHIPSNGTMSYSDFLNVCPALIYIIDQKTFQQEDIHDHTHSTGVPHAFQNIPGKVWGYSTLAVLIISLVGLLGVAVIPIMQKVFYNHLLQLLVALAVGALSGDALLHLLPHALAAHPDHEHTHQMSVEDESQHLQSVWKGLTALLCIFFFFLVERILTIVTEKKRRRKTMGRLKKKRCEQLCDIEKSSAVGAKLSSHDADDHLNCDQMVMVVHPNKSLKGYADATHDVLLHQCDESLSQPEGNFEDDVIDSSHASFGHSHSGHGHAHSVPGSVAAVAWMVILGDGIHNLSDGLAIGAAFASSVTGGVSTSIAVFCHELPHEIGDFAVLLRAGMSIRQAIVYNCVSSLLCIIGMVIGVAIGNIHSASIWIFAGVGGMFLYISMVDMIPQLPEMTAVDTKKGEPQFLHLFLQVCGIFVGAGIMLLIAVYEQRLQLLLD